MEIEIYIYLFAKKQINMSGVVCDIDGVLWRDHAPIDGAKEALKRLEDARVPVCFVTNGGGVVSEMMKGGPSGHHPHLRKHSQRAIKQRFCRNN